MFGLFEFGDQSQAICPIRNSMQEGNFHIVKYKGCKYEARLLASNKIRAKLQKIRSNGLAESGSVSCEKKKALYKKSKTSKSKENVTHKVSSPAPESTVPPSHVRSPVATSTVKHDSSDASTVQRNSTIVPENVVHATSQKLTEIQNILVTKSDPVVLVKKLSYDDLNRSTFEEQLENVTRKLFTEASSPASESTVPLPHIGSSAAISTSRGVAFDPLTSQRNSTVSETVVHTTSQRLQKIQNTLTTNSSPVNELKKQSYEKPKIVMIQKISLKASSKLLTRVDSLVPEFEVPFSHICPPVPDFINKSDEHRFQEHASLDSSISQQNSSYPRDTIIEETDVSSRVEASYTTEHDLGGYSDENLVNDVEFNTAADDSATLLLMQANHQDTDLNLSSYKLDPLSHNTEIAFPKTFLTSTPHYIIHKPTLNIAEDNADSIKSNTRSALKVVLKLPRHTKASNDGESSDSEPDDPDYEPPGENSSDSASDAETRTNQNGNHQLDKDKNSRREKSNVSSGMDISASVSIPRSNAVDDDAMQVEKSRGRNGDKKLNFCFYCHKKHSKIARHLELKHKDEEDVKKFCVLPKNNKERRKIIDIIRKKGNFLFNTQSEYNDGELIVSRRPNMKFNRSARQFKACANCKAFFATSSLRVHFQKCTGRSSKKTRLVMVMSKKVVRRIHDRATEETANVLFPPLREDEVVRLIRYDELVIVYANKMCQKYGDRRYYDMVRQRIRLLGRLLSTLRVLNQEITDLTSVYDPKFCDDVFEAINIEGKLHPSTKCYETPSVAFGLGTLLKQIGSILINECIKKHDDVKKKSVKDFLKLFAQEVTFSVNRTVEESQAQLNRRKKVQLPSMGDIKKLHTYLTQKRNEAFQKLSDSFSAKEWMNLAETTLTSIQLFNRRRAGEIERTLIEDFRSHQSIDVNTDKDLFKTLSAQNREIAKKYVRFTIRGKLNRTVPVLLDARLLESIELILHHRKNMKIREKNPYVFGIRGGDKSRFKYLRACTLMRKFSVDCGATNPERLRGTKLRKHIATTCTSLNLSENQVTDLANFMGHAEKIHKDIYRQPLVNREILQMSKLLEAARGEANSEDDTGSDTDDDGEALNHNHHGQDTDERDDQTYSRNDSSMTSMKSQNKKYTGSIKRKRSTSPYGPVKRVPWNDDEKETVLRLFGADLKNMKLPSLSQIQKAITDNPCLRNRTSPQIKTWLHNQTKKKKPCLGK